MLYLSLYLTLYIRRQIVALLDLLGARLRCLWALRIGVFVGEKCGLSSPS